MSKIDELVQEEIRQYQEEHKTTVEAKYGNIYVSVWTNINQQDYQRLKRLFELMCLDYSLNLSKYDDYGKCVFCIYEDNSKYVEFIQKFIDNSCRLIVE